MTQNIYDDQAFFDGYSQLPRSINGLNGAPEWPTIRALLPPMEGLRVLDIGCGYGWFCRWAAEQGASSVIGVDISEKMLEKARRETHSLSISYTRADLELIELAEGNLDLVYSSLALHYIDNLDVLLRKIYRSLALNGKFVFSVEHPLYTAPSQPDWITTSDGKLIWPLDNYLAEGQRITDWFTDGVIKQHRTVATYINLLISAGFSLNHLDEWGPSTEQVEQQPEWARERCRPPFLLIACEKR
jgi:SAM-dependent methyltransferase